jgi:hypothetical protein
MKDIYLAFRNCCRKEQMIPDKVIMSQNKLGSDLKQRPGLERFQSNKTFYKGLRIKPECRVSEDEEEERGHGKGGYGRNSL